jgi:hypothetical protein
MLLIFDGNIPYFGTLYHLKYQRRPESGGFPGDPPRPGQQRRREGEARIQG